jgi:hypothetical protein
MYLRYEPSLRIGKMVDEMICRELKQSYLVWFMTYDMLYTEASSAMGSFGH